jgi:trehalose 6-phosphate synthase
MSADIPYAADHNSSPGLSPVLPTVDCAPKNEAKDREPRLIVVSNRLPVTITKDDNGDYSFKVSATFPCIVCCFAHSPPQMSSGGLVSALSGAKKIMSFTWIGWTGKDVRSCDGEGRPYADHVADP